MKRILPVLVLLALLAAACTPAEQPTPNVPFSPSTPQTPSTPETPTQPTQPEQPEDPSTAVAGLQYLTGYEIPAIDLKDRSACTSSGQETWGETSWYNYLTTNEDQQVVTHTYAYNGKQYRNWTALVDKDKKSPLWNAFVMHKVAYPDNNLGRSGSWTYESGTKNNTDPGIPTDWQRSVASSDYSRGHCVASNYRQVTEDANWQTFYWTNQSLQWQNGFNSGVWSSLEMAVVANAPSGRDTLYVVVGLLFEDPNNIVSTNQGVITDKQARKLHVGGEVLAFVW